jgi:dipeptidyl aminopeptidase/acylaminoacyl peptidase
VYVRDRSLIAQPFDPKALRLGRDATPIAEDVAFSLRWDAFFSLSDQGDLAYETGHGLEMSQLLWVDEAGKAIGTVGKQTDYQGLALSHDGRRVAVTITDPVTRHWDIWIEDLARSTSTRLTFDPGNEWNPIWSPDDSRILYTSNSNGIGDIMMKRSSGTGAEEKVYDTQAFTIASDWSPDGKTILFQEQGTTGSNRWDLWIYSLEEHKARVFVKTPFAEQAGRFSPDGSWVAYQSDESGKFQIYVLPSSGNGGKWQISTDGGARPRWSREGKRIYYLAPDSKVITVDVAAKGDEFTAGVPRELFPGNIKPVNGPQYDISADGKRFLINTPIQRAEVAPITLVQNWTAALKK